MCPFRHGAWHTDVNEPLLSCKRLSFLTLGVFAILDSGSVCHFRLGVFAISDSGSVCHFRLGEWECLLFQTLGVFAILYSGSVCHFRLGEWECLLFYTLRVFAILDWESGGVPFYTGSCTSRRSISAY